MMKNWRPISLLNVDYKIASACVAKRMKKFMPKLISETQSGFIKGRYIGECSRLIYDLLDKSEKSNIPGTLLLLDFEKAFDSLEWNFITKTLEFLGFGQYIISFFTSLYSDISSCILNNGHFTDFFNISIGLRQGEKLSPIMFSLFLEDVEQHL